MRSDHNVIQWLLLALSPILAAGCLAAGNAAADGNRGPMFRSATVSRNLRSNHPPAPDVAEIRDANRLAELIAHFPGVGEGRHSGRPPAGYIPNVVVVLTRADGTTVMVKSEYEVWNEGRGDWDVNGDLGRFVDVLFAPPPRATGPAK